MPSFRHRAILPALLLLAATQAVPSTPAAETPRGRVALVAQAIEDHYFDAGRGRTIADGLREAAGHGAFDALASVAATGETLLILGDLANLTDYRTGEGAVASALGIEFARDAARARGEGDFEKMRTMWQTRPGDPDDAAGPHHHGGALLCVRGALPVSGRAGAGPGIPAA